MTVDGRGRRAGRGFRDEIDDLTATDPGRSSFARFDAFRRRKQRNQRIGAGVFVGSIALFGAFVLFVEFVRLATLLALFLVCHSLPHGRG